MNAINSGQLLVDYLGHGSEEQWSGSDIFDTNTVASLTNGSQLPVFLIMDCLNGFFQDVYAQPLAVTLDAGAERRSRGGAGVQRTEPGSAADQAGHAGGAEACCKSSQPTWATRLSKAKSQISDAGGSQDLHPVRRSRHAGEAACQRPPQ